MGHCSRDRSIGSGQLSYSRPCACRSHNILALVYDDVATQTRPSRIFSFGSFKNRRLIFHVLMRVSSHPNSTCQTRPPFLDARPTRSFRLLHQVIMNVIPHVSRVFARPSVCPSVTLDQRCRLKNSTLRRWYTQILTSQPHGNSKKPKTSSGDGLAAELCKNH